jgi:regulator of nucleoside diphosphate kinase
MQDANLPPLILSRHDVARLEALLSTRAAAASPMAARLEAEIARATVREPSDMPPEVVTMNSMLVCVDDTTGVERRLRLVYPDQADGSTGQVSVLAPVGAALLGLSVGQSIDWPLPDGRSTRLRVTAVLDQPEAHGRLD